MREQSEMNPNYSLYRKIAYLTAFVLLAIPIVWLGAPSTVKEQGGKLAQLRSDARLGQADLGAIDPASEVIRMATLGMRGFAVTMLWSKANDYKKTEDWTAYQTTLEQLARLQPYFIKAWEHQAWNLSYNVSVELDNVRDRFFYVKQGIKYLKEGIQYNRQDPYLLDDLGWFTGNKVGRADEHELYRKMYRLDTELNPPQETDSASRDNWLASRKWYDQAIQAIDSGAKHLGTKNPVTFFANPSRSQMSYAEAIETEGTFGEQAKRAWREGARLWKEYGEREMPSTDNDMIRLVDAKRWDEETKKLRSQLDGLSPGLETKMHEEALASLTPLQRKMHEHAPEAPNAEETKAQREAGEIMDINVDKVAARIAQERPEKAKEAQVLAKEIHAAERRQRAIDSSRDVANFAYWRIRADLEQTPEALEGHRLAHEAKRTFQNEGDPEGAKERYERSFDAWAKALAQFPELPPDSSTGSDLMDVIEDYIKVLDTMELSLADPEVEKKFALWNILEANDQQRKHQDVIDKHKKNTGAAPSKEEKGEQAKPLINPADAIVH
jgi:hypothetical protein